MTEPLPERPNSGAPAAYFDHPAAYVFIQRQVSENGKINNEI